MDGMNKWTKKNLLCWVYPVCCLSLLLLIISFAQQVFAGSNRGEGENCFTGTYIFETASDSLSMWTFTRDGNVLVTSSVQKTLNFSDIQGVWKVADPGKVKSVLLDFSFNNTGEPINVARLDVTLRKTGKTCDELEGEFELRFFEDGEDPLDPSTDTGTPLSDTLHGRRLIVE